MVSNPIRNSSWEADEQSRAIGCGLGGARAEAEGNASQQTANDAWFDRSKPERLLFSWRH